MERVGVFGSGNVGEALANGFLKLGYEVMRGSRDPKKLAEWKSKAGEKAHVGTFSETAEFGKLIVFAVKGSAGESIINDVGPNKFSGKTVIDTTNPLADAPPEHGVLKVFTSANESLMERLQKLAPKAHFVKAFSCIGSGLMFQPGFEKTKPTMFICGNDSNAKNEVSAVLTQFGWETADMGLIEAARAIEPLAVLWCIPGFINNQWSHAFKLLRK